MFGYGSRHRGVSKKIAKVKSTILTQAAVAAAFFAKVSPILFEQNQLKLNQFPTAIS